MKSTSNTSPYDSVKKNRATDRKLVHGLLGCTDSGTMKDGCPGTPVTGTGFRIQAPGTGPCGLATMY